MIVLRVEGDPATWILGASSPASVLQRDLINQDGPVTVDVDAPLKGRLVLSTRSLAHVAVLTPPAGWTSGGFIPAGWIPGGGIQPRGLLYVPSTTGPVPDNPGYTLPPFFDVAALESDIVTAMTDGTTIAVEVTEGIFSGSLLLNGAALPFVVISPAP